MNEHPILFSGEMVRAILEGRKTMTRRVIKDIRTAWRDGTVIDPYDRDYITCPYGWPGDRLWVRETWAYADDQWEMPHLVYKADGIASPEKWRPSIHMPRRASRITLEITEIRVERLQEITEEDAIREGITVRGEPIMGAKIAHKREFQILWDSINGKKYPWSNNPWVWVISFKPIIPQSR